MRSLWRFLAYSKPYWKLLTVALAASLIRMAMSTYLPIYAGNVTRYAVAAFDKDELANCGIG
jgi:ABC-type multidrug transport system fused ATPase/permease subunit